MRNAALALAVLALALGPVTARAADAPKGQTAAPAKAGQIPRADGSLLAGLGFVDKPIPLGDDGTFKDVMGRVAQDAQRRCGALEAFGWEIKGDDQKRVDGLTGSLMAALRKAEFKLTPVTSKAVSRDVTLFTADSKARRLLVLMSLSPATARDQMAQLVLLICDTSRN